MRNSVRSVLKQYDHANPALMYLWYCLTTKGMLLSYFIMKSKIQKFSDIRRCHWIHGSALGHCGNNALPLSHVQLHAFQ